MQVNFKLLNLFFFAGFLFLMLVGCSDAERGRMTTLGSAAEITCYSGGQAVFTDKSTGRVETDSKGAGVYYKSAISGNFVHTYADCIVQSKS